MRHRILIAALLAGSIFSPALAQEVEATIAAETQVQAVVERVAAVADDQEQRVERGDRSWRTTGDSARIPPGRAERAPRQDWQQRQQAEPEPRREWVRQRMEGGNDRNVGGDRVQSQAPVVVAPPPAPVSTNAGWRGDWQRRAGEVTNTPASPPVARQETVDGNRSWRGNNNNGGSNNGGWNRGEQRTPPVTGNSDWQRRDRDRDGTPNWRDRDRDNDGVRNNRDWDRNNNGTVDRRWDRNRDGVRDNRWNDRNWNNGQQRWGNNQNWNNNQGWNRQWRNDNRYDWQRYRTTNRNLFRQPRYYSPYGYNYSYQRFDIGIYLDSVFFGSRYRINDPWQYRLPYAEYPYEWVRYYDDVLLVDTRNGYIVDVIHNFFW